MQWIYFTDTAILNPLFSNSYCGISSAFFFPFLELSQNAVWSLKRMRHLCMSTSHGICRSCLREKLARIPLRISRAINSHTNEHTVHLRPTLKQVKRFWERVSLQALREINLRTNILNEFIKNHVIPRELLIGTYQMNSST